MLQNKQYLSPGGSGGIGFEIVKLLTEKGTRVIIIDNNQGRLDETAKKLDNIVPIAIDVTDDAVVEQLVNKITNDFPELNVAIFSAGLGHSYDLRDSSNAWEKASKEMDVNYISVIRLTEKLLPHLLQQDSAAIVNISSGLAFSPNIKVPTYSASKAALHSYTISLRLALRDTRYAVLDKYTVELEIVLYIPKARRGFPVTVPLSEIMNAILYKFKTGMQLHQLPVKTLF